MQVGAAPVHNYATSGPEVKQVDPMVEPHTRQPALTNARVHASVGFAQPAVTADAPKSEKSLAGHKGSSGIELGTTETLEDKLIKPPPGGTGSPGHTAADVVSQPLQ
jgi:hypothetical protein